MTCDQVEVPATAVPAPAGWVVWAAAWVAVAWVFPKLAAGSACCSRSASCCSRCLRVAVAQRQGCSSFLPRRAVARFKPRADANTKQDCALLASINSVQKFWTAEFPRQNLQYQPAKTRFFRDQVSTGCGPAESAMGPFYCPADQYVYLDLGFFDEFKTKFGASAGTFAQAYVLAHEYGHHVQDLLGTSAQVERAGNKTGPESASVRLELQADCYAGVWANHAVNDGYVKNLTDADIADGIDAATKVGDDYIQKKFQGRINRESWTHGSSAQRVNWFQNGLTRGNMNDCDTFSGGI
jgi:uncharacterized protein